MAKKNKIPWFVTKGNVTLVLVCAALLGSILVFNNKTAKIKAKDATTVRNIKHLQNKLDQLLAKNERTIYMPKPGDVNLTATQIKTVKWLTSFFSQITTFDNPTAYHTNYDLAKRNMKDAQFFKDFMTPPDNTQGNSNVLLSNIKLSNVRTQVLVMGPEKYQVITTYIPYHNTSDLYQRDKLTTLSQAFDIEGTIGNFTTARINKDINMDYSQVPVNEID